MQSGRYWLFPEGTALGRAPIPAPVWYRLIPWQEAMAPPPPATIAPLSQPSWWAPPQVDEGISSETMEILKRYILKPPPKAEGVDPSTDSSRAVPMLMNPGVEPLAYQRIKVEEETIIQEDAARREMAYKKELNTSSELDVKNIKLENLPLNEYPVPRKRRLDNNDVQSRCGQFLEKREVIDLKVEYSPEEHPRIESPVPKRRRTKFTDAQRGYLYSAFREAPYINSEQRSYLAAKLNVPEETIKVWFMNQRAKFKKAMSDVYGFNTSGGA